MLFLNVCPKETSGINSNSRISFFIITYLNLNIMFLKIHNPRQAIIQSYNRPVLYKNHILLNGAVVVRFR